MLAKLLLLLRLQGRRRWRRAVAHLPGGAVLGLVLLAGSYYFIDFALAAIGDNRGQAVVLLSGVCVLCWAGTLLVRDLEAAHSDLEWVRALPLGAAGTFGYRLVMRAFPRDTDASLLLVTLLMMSHRSGWGVLSIPLCLMLFFILLVLFGSVHVVMESVLFAYGHRSGRRAIQRAARVLLPVAGLGMWMYFRSMEGQSGAVPAALLWSPPGLVAEILAGKGWLIGVLMAEVALVAFGCEIMMERVLMREHSQPARPRQPPSFWLLRTVFSPYQVILLRRVGVRPVLVFAFPLLWLGVVLFLRAFGPDALGTPGRCGVLAVLLAGFFTPVGAFGLEASGPALWLLATVPKSLERLMAEGAQLAVTWALVVAATVMSAAGAVWSPLDVPAFLYTGLMAALLALLKHYGFVLGQGALDVVATGLIAAVMVEAPMRRAAVLLLSGWIVFRVWQRSRNQLATLLEEKTGGGSWELKNRTPWDTTSGGVHHVDQPHTNQVSSQQPG
jgi:hypothetical protein